MTIVTIEHGFGRAAQKLEYQIHEIDTQALKYILYSFEALADLRRRESEE